MNRAQNKLEGKTGRDGDSAPERTWFQTKKEREAEKANQRLGDFSGLSNAAFHKKQKGKKGKNQGPLSADDRIQYEIEKSAAYSVRSAKRDKREKRKRACNED